ncbi:MAG: transposase [Chloroflexi bacterium]|nr:transposase [Chloroflexota bacterium]
MIGHDSLLVTLVQLVDRLPTPPPPPKRGRGHPRTYPDRLFLQALVIMIVRHLHRVHELLTVLDQPTAEMQTVRGLLTVRGQFPSRRTWERRLAALPDALPAQIRCLGHALVTLIQPWASSGRAAAIDSTVLRAKGGVWHQKDRAQGIVPHTAIDTEAHWTKSGWHGWVYGWKLHLVTSVAAVWIPLAAELTPANRADSELAPQLLVDLPAAVRFVLGDRHYNTPEIGTICTQSERILVTTQYGRYPHTDDGVEVRRLFHKLRSVSIENFNGQFKGIFDMQGQVPTKGVTNTRRFALGAVFVYQLTLWYRHEHDLDLRVGLEPFLKAA